MSTAAQRRRATLRRRRVRSVVAAAQLAEALAPRPGGVAARSHRGDL